MDIQGFIVPMLLNSPQVKAKIQNISGQPVQHVAKCFSAFLDQLNSGPGLVDKQLVRQQRFNQIYLAGLRMGFQDWQSQMCAADCAGYKPIDVAMSFSTKRGWDCSVEQLQKQHARVMPVFLQRGKKAGLFQDDHTEKKHEGIPDVGQNKTKGGIPPWRQKQAAPQSAAGPTCTPNMAQEVK